MRQKWHHRGGVPRNTPALWVTSFDAQKKGDPPGGDNRAGRVAARGWMRRPVPDAGSAIRAFSSESLPRTRSGVSTGSHEEKRAKQKSAPSIIS